MLLGRMVMGAGTVHRGGGTAPYGTARDNTANLLVVFSVLDAALHAVLGALSIDIDHLVRSGPVGLFLCDIHPPVLVSVALEKHGERTLYVQRIRSRTRLRCE